MISSLESARIRPWCRARALFPLRSVAVLFALGLIVCAGGVGCYRPYVRERNPLTTQEIIELSAQGATPTEIKSAIDESRTVYGLTTRDILDLSEKGVDPEVIEYMRSSEKRAAAETRRYHAPYAGYWGGYWGPYWGPSPYVRFGYGAWCW